MKNIYLFLTAFLVLVSFCSNEILAEEYPQCDETLAEQIYVCEKGEWIGRSIQITERSDNFITLHTQFQLTETNSERLTEGDTYQITENSGQTHTITILNIGVDGDVNKVRLSTEKTAAAPRVNTNINASTNTTVKIMPEVASETAIERIGLTACKAEDGCTIVLKEVGAKGDTKNIYEVHTEVEGKAFGLFKTRTDVTIQVDAETGEVLKVKKPWWIKINQQ
jgi:hypothetical protein